MKPEFIDTLFGYTSAMAIARMWLEDNLISEKEFEMIRTKMNKKYGISLGSILIDMS